MTEQKIYINSRLMKTSDSDDTEFVIDLGNRFTFKRMILNSFCMDNLLQNFYDEWSDFTFQTNVAGVINTYRLQCDFHISQDDFLTWFNANNGAPNFRLANRNDDPSLTYKKFLGFRSVGLNNNWWRPVGLGWDKIGFKCYKETDNQALGFSESISAIHVYDFTQSSSILIRFNNLPNMFTSGWGQMSFQVPNNSAFGGRIETTFQNVVGNQQLVLGQSVSLTQLHITLCNCDLKKIKTISGNKNDIEVIMNISLFDE